MGAPHLALIDRAAALIKPHMGPGGRLHGDVSSIVVAESGREFAGLCIDTPSWGTCAERSALAAMVTAGEYRFRQVVAVWRNTETGALHVLPPCGICREFMRQLDDTNLAAEVVLGDNRSAPLSDLLPEHAWPAPIERSR
jgi:cytidine deaminase